MARHRPVLEVVADWIAAERHLQKVPKGSLEERRLRARIDLLREEHRALPVRPGEVQRSSLDQPG